MKKTLAILLALALVLCMMPSAAFAAGETALTDSNTTVTLEGYSYAFDGTAKTPRVLSVVIGSGTTNQKTLTENSDYTVTYEDNINAGTSAKAVITGMGNYSGSVNKFFTISKVDLSKVTAELSKTKAEYNGSDQTPTVTVKNGTTVIPTSAYNISWSGTVLNAGTYTATISKADGNDNCENTASATFTIEPFDWSKVSFSIDKQTGSLPTDEAGVEAITHYYVNGAEATGVSRSFLTTFTKAAISGNSVTFTVDTGATGYNSANFKNAFSSAPIAIETAVAIDDSNLE